MTSCVIIFNIMFTLHYCTVFSKSKCLLKKLHLLVHMSMIVQTKLTFLLPPSQWRQQHICLMLDHHNLMPSTNAQILIILQLDKLPNVKHKIKSQFYSLFRGLFSLDSKQSFLPNLMPRITYQTHFF